MTSLSAFLNRHGFLVYRRDDPRSPAGTLYHRRGDTIELSVDPSGILIAQVKDSDEVHLSTFMGPMALFKACDRYFPDTHGLTREDAEALYDLCTLGLAHTDFDGSNSDIVHGAMLKLAAQTGKVMT